MSMSTHVIGFVPPDDTFKKMKDIWDACEKMNISPPKAVYDFFGGDFPDDSGVSVEIPYRDWSTDMCTGMDIDLDSIPKHVKSIRFYNSW